MNRYGVLAVPDDVAAILADPDAHYSVSTMPGVAFVAHSAESTPDEDTEWSGYENATGRVLMVMVGDDTRHSVDPADVLPLSDDAFCGGCGQIGCTAEPFYSTQEA